MPKTPLDKGWLEALVAAELDRHDPAAALARLPEDVREVGASRTDLVPAARLLVARSLRFRPLEPESTRTATFLEEARLHVTLLLDLDVLRGAPSDRERLRADIATFLAAGVGDVEAALEVLPVVPMARPHARDVELALRAAEEALAARFHPPGDPVLGLPLHPGAVAVLRRRLARVAAGFLREGRLDPHALARHAAYAERESLLLVEALAGLFRDEPPDERAAAVRHRQLSRLGLSRAAARAARAAIAAPRGPAELAAAAPETVRAFLVEQLYLAVLRAKLAGDGPTRYVEAFVAAAGLDPTAVAAARVEAAAQHGDLQVWFDALEDEERAIDWLAIAGDWGAATDAMVERVSAAVTDNLGAVLTEIRQTGELGQLLARAAAGAKLTADERRKVRAQLIDLAKAVPALAIFAAPGGMLLLPLLAKLLPFNLLPSAWDRHDAGKDPGPPPGRGAPRKPGR